MLKEVASPCVLAALNSGPQSHSRDTGQQRFRSCGQHGHEGRLPAKTPLAPDAGAVNVTE